MEYCSSCHEHINDCSCSRRKYSDKKHEEKKRVETSCHLGNVSTQLFFSVPCGEKVVVYENFTDNHNKVLVTGSMFRGVAVAPAQGPLDPIEAKLVLIIETKHDKRPIKKTLTSNVEVSVLVEDVTRICVKCINPGTRSDNCNGSVDIQQLVCVCCPKE